MTKDIHIDSAVRVPWLGLLFASVLVAAALALGDTAIADLIAAVPAPAPTAATG